MAKFENLRKLPEVLDDVHRRTVIDTLGKLGVELSRRAPWREVEAAIKDNRMSKSNYSPSSVKYESSMVLGPFVGSYHMLDYSTTTEYAEDREDVVSTLNIGSSKWHRELLLKDARKSRPSGRVAVLRDAQPLVFHLDDYTYIQQKIPIGEFVTLPEHTVAERVKEAFGPEAVEYLTDEMAGTIIAALQAARTSNTTIP